MRLIDADLAVAKCNEDIEAVKDIPQRVDGILDAIMNIHECPTVDAVPVVRCRDCKRWSTVLDRKVAGYGFCQSWSQLLDTKWNDFCSRGERRTDDADVNTR